MENNKELRLAVLIDADNIPSSNITATLKEIARYGSPTFKRIYADWTKPHVSGWKSVLLENAITPIQQYSYTTGKNSTDSAMIIDAMDILYSGKVDGFCIVSSDSDFTRLAIRLREAGMKVFGFGERKTPSPFITACDKFVYIEILQEAETGIAAGPGPRRSSSKQSINKLDQKLVKFICDSINDIADEDGWSFLGELGSMMMRKKPDFDPRNYGFNKLFPLVKTIPNVEVDERKTGNKNITHVFVRVRNKQ